VETGERVDVERRKSRFPHYRGLTTVATYAPASSIKRDDIPSGDVISFTFSRGGED